MSSANNAVSYMTAYMMQSAAAANVSTVSNVRKTGQDKGSGFDMIMNRVSDNLTRNTQQDVAKQTATGTDTKQTRSDTVEKPVDNTDYDNTQTVQNSDNKTDVSTPKDATNAVNVKENSQDTVTTTNVETEAVETDIVVAEMIPSPVAQSTIIDLVVTPETDAELLSVIETDVKDLISQITENFDISEEDIVNAMQVLGLMATDLLNPSVIPQVITQAMGQEASVDLITDSDIYTSLQDLMEGAESMKDGLMNEFDLSEEELDTALSDAGKSFKNRLEDTMVVDQEESPEPEVITKNDFTSNLQNKELKAPQSEAFTEDSSVEISLENKVELNNTGSGTSKESGNNKSLFGESGQSQNLFNQVMNNITEAAANVESFTATSYVDRAQMENIVRQITEKITISAGAGETSMELALHPASLGNVNILLTSGKDGIVAKFTAQNQIVKEAVESQMVQLQQRFEEQGIKVTSVEVTIASHGFEQNLEQGNDRRSDDTDDGKKTRPLRRINLTEAVDEELDNISSDAERIAVQMMAHNGNSVDYSA